MPSANDSGGANKFQLLWPKNEATEFTAALKETNREKKEGRKRKKENDLQKNRKDGRERKVEGRRISVGQLHPFLLPLYPQ